MAMGLMAGRNDLAATQRYRRLLTQEQRRWLNFPCKNGISTRKCPSYKALWSFVHGIDAEAFATCLNAWLSAHIGTLPRALALDDKWVRDRALSLCLSEHKTGAPVAVGFPHPADTSEQTKREGEQTVSKCLSGQTDLNGAVVTAAPMPFLRPTPSTRCDRSRRRPRVPNQKRKQAGLQSRQTKGRFRPPFLNHTEEPDTSHGRLDQRQLGVHPIEPITTEIPDMRSLIVAVRARKQDPDEIPETSYYLSSQPPAKGCAQNFSTLIRKHWGGCENRNHWVCDHCMREDNTRLWGYNANCTLAALRICLIVIKSLRFPKQSWPEIKERSQRYPKVPLAAILKLSAK